MLVAALGSSRRLRDPGLEVIRQIAWLVPQMDGALAALARLDFVHRKPTGVAEIIGVLAGAVLIEREDDQDLQVRDALGPLADQFDWPIAQVFVLVKGPAA